MGQAEKNKETLIGLMRSIEIMMKSPKMHERSDADNLTRVLLRQYGPVAVKEAWGTAKFRNKVEGTGNAN